MFLWAGAAGPQSLRRLARLFCAHPASNRGCRPGLGAGLELRSLSWDRPGDGPYAGYRRRGGGQGRGWAPGSGPRVWGG